MGEGVAFEVADRAAGDAIIFELDQLARLGEPVGDAFCGGRVQTTGGGFVGDGTCLGGRDGGAVGGEPAHDRQHELTLVIDLGLQPLRGCAELVGVFRAEAVFGADGVPPRGDLLPILRLLRVPGLLREHGLGGAGDRLPERELKRAGPDGDFAAAAR